MEEESAKCDEKEDVAVGGSNAPKPGRTTDIKTRRG